MQLKSVLRKLIDERGLTVAGVSKASSVSQQTIHNWLAGTEPRSLTQVKKVADYFEVSLDYICFGIKEKNKVLIEDFNDEINAGVFEVVLRRVKR